MDCAQKMLQHIKLHHSSTSIIKDFKQDTNSNGDQEILDEYFDNEEGYKVKPKNKRKSMVKFSFSEKATRICAILLMVLTFT